jgi:biopolymer transport protein TolQ
MTHPLVGSLLLSSFAPTLPILPALTAPLAALPAQAGSGTLRLFLESGPVAWLIFSILAFFSVGSWAILLSKNRQFRSIRRHNERFLQAFRQSSRFSEINTVAAQHKASTLVGLFQAGYLEIDTQVKARAQRAGDTGTGGGYQIKSLAAIERSLQRAIAVEMLALSKNATFLATTAAVTPFIGLFGTVWGIMVAFNDISASGSASILAVAPGIAEALVNTAAGLVAAIPALIGYNQLSSKLRSAKIALEDFALEFLNLAERNFT